MKLSYAFRRPEYPVLCDVPGDLVAARERQQLERHLGSRNLPATEVLELIDSRGKVWGVHVHTGLILPFIGTQHRTKSELLNLYMKSPLGQKIGLPISESVAMRKRFPEFINMIVELLNSGSRSIARVVPSNTTRQAGTCGK